MLLSCCYCGVDAAVLLLLLSCCCCCCWCGVDAADVLMLSCCCCCIDAVNCGAAASVLLLLLFSAALAALAAADSRWILFCLFFFVFAQTLVATMQHGVKQLSLGLRKSKRLMHTLTTEAHDLHFVTQESSYQTIGGPQGGPTGGP